MVEVRVLLLISIWIWPWLSRSVDLLWLIIKALRLLFISLNIRLCHHRRRCQHWRLLLQRRYLRLILIMMVCSNIILPRIENLSHIQSTSIYVRQASYVLSWLIMNTWNSRRYVSLNMVQLMRFVLIISLLHMRNIQLSTTIDALFHTSCIINTTWIVLIDLFSLPHFLLFSDLLAVSQELTQFVIDSFSTLWAKLNMTDVVDLVLLGFGLITSCVLGNLRIICVSLSFVESKSVLLIIGFLLVLFLYTRNFSFIFEISDLEGNLSSRIWGFVLAITSCQVVVWLLLVDIFCKVCNKILIVIFWNLLRLSLINLNFLLGAKFLSVMICITLQILV